MIFECEGVRYDTSSMDVYYTGKAHQPAVYVTPDLKCVFVLTMDRNQGVGVHQADAEEIRRLWNKYDIAALLRVLSTLGRAPVRHEGDSKAHVE